MTKKVTVEDLTKKILKLKNIDRLREVMFEELLQDFKTPELRDAYRVKWNQIEKDEEGK